MKNINWQIIALIFLGLCVGFFLGATHPLEWNRPTHFTDIFISFVLFPLLIVFLSLTEKSSKRLIYLILAIMLPYLIAWQMMHRIMHQRFFDDMFFMWFVITFAYILLGFTINYIKTKKKISS